MISARLLPRPDQIAQLLERCRRHEAGLDKISLAKLIARRTGRRDANALGLHRRSALQWPSIRIINREWLAGLHIGPEKRPP